MSDYKKYLYTDIPNVTGTFELLYNWYDRDKDGYEPLEMRAEMFPINWKSKMGTSDASLNFYTHLDILIYKGNYVIDKNGDVYMLNWTVTKEINCQHTQAAKCNHMLKLERVQEEKWGSDGRLVQEGGTHIVFDSIPAMLSEYAGRPDYTPNYNAPGIVPDMLIAGTVQFNEATAQMQINDEFDWGKFRYRIVNIVYTEITIDGTRGVLGFNARRVGGEYTA
jgi:hypothetical protein